MNKATSPELNQEPIDNLLSEFFRSQVPAVWPKLSPPLKASRQIRWTARLAIAASLIVGVMSYISLSRHIPPPRPPVINRQQTVGFLPTRKLRNSVVPKSSTPPPGSGAERDR